MSFQFFTIQNTCGAIMTSRPERREEKRYKKAVSAICEINGHYYKARTFDISQHGMTLLTGPTVPMTDTFMVECRLKNGASFVFKVEEMQRRVLRRGDKQFLRLGLSILNPPDDVMMFFQELAGVLVKQKTEDTTDDEDIDTDPGLDDDHLHGDTGEAIGDYSDSKSGEARFHMRLEFRLPVMARVDGEIFRCETLDIGTRGISVRTPPDFPPTETFSVIALDPTGPEIALSVREMYRVPMKDQGGFRLGLRIIGGSREFRDFLKKHDLWKKK